MNEPELITASRIRQIISLIDLTNLDDECNVTDIHVICEQSNTIAGHVAAICIWPRFVADANKLLAQDSPVKVATVVNFPSGNDPVQSTCETIEKAIEDGADEIDYVLPYRQMINGNVVAVASELRTVREHITGHTKMKVILETGMLESAYLIQSAANIAIDQGADFIKTSTGKVAVNATPEAASIMLDAIASAPSDVGFKAAGGIRTIADADIYLTLAEDRMGRDWVNATHFRFGASGLLQDALKQLGESPASTTNDSGDY